MIQATLNIIEETKGTNDCTISRATYLGWRLHKRHRSRSSNRTHFTRTPNKKNTMMKKMSARKVVRRIKKTGHRLKMEKKRRKIARWRTAEPKAIAKISREIS